MSDRLFTRGEAFIAKLCLADPTFYHMTEPECRACQAVIRHVERGTVMHEDDVHIARSLFASILEEGDPRKL
jgi:hypothetical protein